MSYGALESKWDPRDFKYDPADGAGFDWETGFDIERLLGMKLITKDQNGSSSCGGQAWAYYGEVLEKVATGDYEPRSAKWIYHHTRTPGGNGSYGRDNASFVIKNGWVKESLCPSYQNGKPPKEEHFVTLQETSEMREEAKLNRALSYLSVTPNIDMVAQAIRDNHGCVLVVNGSNNGTWRSEFPEPPKEKEWGHFVFAGKAKMIGGEKYIGIKNSWGDKTGKNGWQWLGEDYFKSGHVREGWTHAWDYKPPLQKALLIRTVRLLQELVNLLKK